MGMSQFFLALIIDPPLPSVRPSTWPGMRVAWAKPLPPPSHLGSHLGGGGARGRGPATAAAAAAAPPLGGLVGAPGSSQQMQVGSFLAAAGQLQPNLHASRGQSPGGWTTSSAAVIASRVHWLVANVSEVTHAPGAAPQVQESVYVWAVDGLAEVTLNGLPRGGVTSHRGASGPRAVLWGRDSRSLTWQQPLAFASAGPELRWDLVAYVLYPQLVPVIAVCKTLAWPAGQYGELAAFAAATVTQDAGSAACPHTGILVQFLVQQTLPGCPTPLASLQPHPRLTSLVAALGQDGAVCFWS
ncbi:hypothetical protein V8C86DRAFT_2982217, partial [Haematococcus lacustris]